MPTAPNNKPPGKWSSIVRDFRNCVPIVKSTEHLGSGLLVSSDGFILTNEHVVRGHQALLVSLHDGTTAKATPVHNHDRMDLAIVKSSIHTERFFELSADSLANGYDAGDEALAIGHPRGLSFTATTGIVSESERQLPDGVFVQTDVAINPGNSGGPLFDVAGKLIGLNTQVMEESQGLGFAIPARTVWEYWQEFMSLYRHGRISIPTDEQLSQIEEALNPRQLIESAAELAEIEVVREANGEEGLMWTARLQSGNYFSVHIDETVFLLTRYIANWEHLPSPRESRWRTRYRRPPADAAHRLNILYSLLRWQDEMYGLIKFVLTEDDRLFLVGSRETANLDVSEVAWSLSLMAETVDRHADTLSDLLEEG